MWKQALVSFSEQFQHPAWGTVHCRRVHDLALDLARQRDVEIDEGALLAAAYLHDIGAFGPYRQAGVDHAERSVQCVDPILIEIGFPAQGVSLVKEIIRGHMFYACPTARDEAVLFHDADTLDFMGAVGIARVLSIVGLDDWTPDLRSAVELIRRFSRELPDRLITPEAKEIGRARGAEMSTFLAALSDETHALEWL